jgi:branched-chain amino acid transport system ATP-binding protein
MPPQTALELRDVATGYDDVPVVRGVDMAFPKGWITSVIGSNGAGKSTAIKAAVGLLRAWQGRILAAGADITSEPAYRRVSRGIAYVPQGRIVLPEMTVLENLELGGYTLRADRRRIREALDRLTALFPVLGERMGQLAGTMSGGEQQMLAIARALMTSPSVIILDEPSLGLSPKFVQIVFDKLVELKSQGLTVIMVEQKASRALAISDWGYVMHMGQVAFRGPAAELLANEQVKRLYLGELPEGSAFAAVEDDDDA